MLSHSRVGLVKRQNVCAVSQGRWGVRITAGAAAFRDDGQKGSIAVGSLKKNFFFNCAGSFLLSVGFL